MGLNCGIVGLPNVGKSTIFSAMTAAPAEAANYPFCTIEPNVGIVAVKDARLQKIQSFIKTQKVIPAVVEFLDIAGLVKGASKGEGLGNQFLGHIRQVNAIIHVVRCFEDNDIIHVSNRIDPIDDIEIINMELALADLEVVQRRYNSFTRMRKTQNKEQITLANTQEPILEKLIKVLSEGKLGSTVNLSPEDILAVDDLHLITLKKVLYACNIDEACIHTENDHVKKVREYAAKEGAEVIAVCGKLESEISSLGTDEEKREFLEAAGIEESGLDKLIRRAYETLGLRTYFTAGEKEVRAWTFHQGDRAPQAAAVIHTDFEKGFIKAEVYHCDDLFTYHSEAKVKENGKFRIEGKEYVVKDGDIMHFRFNV